MDLLDMMGYVDPPKPTVVDYGEYLRSESWAAKRRRALKFWRYRCCLCNSRVRPHTHHRTYERIGDERLEDLVILCRACHAHHHRKAA